MEGMEMDLEAELHFGEKSETSSAVDEEKCIRGREVREVGAVGLKPEQGVKETQAVKQKEDEEWAEQEGWWSGQGLAQQQGVEGRPSGRGRGEIEANKQGSVIPYRGRGMRGNVDGVGSRGQMGRGYWGGASTGVRNQGQWGNWQGENQGWGNPGVVAQGNSIGTWFQGTSKEDDRYSNYKKHLAKIEARGRGRGQARGQGRGRGRPVAEQIEELFKENRQLQDRVEELEKN